MDTATAGLKPGEILLYKSEVDGNIISVVRREDGSMVLKCGEEGYVYSTYCGGKLLTGSCWDYFNIAPILAPKKDNVLAIGLGGGTSVRQYREFFDVNIDVVEISLEIIGIAEKFFGVREDDRTRIYLGDGIRFLEDTKSVYDVIFVDAFEGGEIPGGMTTAGFFRLVYDRLGDGGVFTMNTLTDKPQSNIICNNVKTVFPSVYVVVYGGNQIVVGLKNPTGLDDVKRKLAETVENGAVDWRLKDMVENTLQRVKPYKIGLNLGDNTRDHEKQNPG